MSPYFDPDDVRCSDDEERVQNALDVVCDRVDGSMLQKRRQLPPLTAEGLNERVSGVVRTVCEEVFDVHRATGASLTQAEEGAVEAATAVLEHIERHPRLDREGRCILFKVRCVILYYN